MRTAAVVFCFVVIFMKEKFYNFFGTFISKI